IHAPASPPCPPEFGAQPSRVVPDLDQQLGFEPFRSTVPCEKSAPTLRGSPLGGARPFRDSLQRAWRMVHGCNRGRMELPCRPPGLKATIKPTESSSGR